VRPVGQGLRDSASAGLPDEGIKMAVKVKNSIRFKMLKREKIPMVESVHRERSLFIRAMTALLSI
jgi:hypothetical protein